MVDIYVTMCHDLSLMVVRQRICRKLTNYNANLESFHPMMMRFMHAFIAWNFHLNHLHVRVSVSRAGHRPPHSRHCLIGYGRKWLCVALRSPACAVPQRCLRYRDEE